ncbi:hypothetical protein DFH08DRAFT_961590 [Mycena albidolilacea]|uniref:Uncharacterized protein n=1 Tax=Mycena albidolilacea TaxID=1033008 RepID=A0AAD7EPE6_9AGAR|nr:hypothetical protein DFH08DRAFT_961590 [Mycena albidolilacea]
MAPSKKAAKAKKLVEAKKAKKNDATKPPKKKAKAEEARLTLKLRLLGPKAPEVSTTPMPEPVSLVSSSDPTPPRNPSQEEVSAAVDRYWLNKGRLSPALEDDKLDDSKTEVLLIRKGTTGGKTIFAAGLVDDGTVDGEELEESADEGRETQGSASPESESDSQKADEDELESDDDKPFDLKLSVPFAGPAVDTCRHHVTPPKSVRVTYRFTTQPRTTVFTHLSNDIELEDMVTAARAAQLTTRSTKEFKVELKDLAAITKGKGNTDGKKDGKKKKRPQLLVTKRKCAESDSKESEAEDGKGDEVDSKKTMLASSTVDMDASSVRRDMCSFDMGNFFEKWIRIYYDSTSEPQDSAGNLSKVILSKRGQIAGLTLLDMTAVNFNRDLPAYPIKIGSGQPKPVPAPQPPSMPAVTSMASMSPYGYPPAPWWPPYQTPPAPQALNCYGDGPSSPPQEIKDARLFPRLESWLWSLDDGLRGADDHNFSQYAPEFQREKYVRVVDLETLQVNDLKRLIPELPHGTATKILAYATADITRIRKVEKKHLRVEAQNGARYA